MTQVTPRSSLFIIVFRLVVCGFSIGFRDLQANKRLRSLDSLPSKADFFENGVRLCLLRLDNKNSEYQQSFQASQHGLLNRLYKIAFSIVFDHLRVQADQISYKYFWMKKQRKETILNCCTKPFRTAIYRLAQHFCGSLIL